MILTISLHHGCPVPLVSAGTVLIFWSTPGPGPRALLWGGFYGRLRLGLLPSRQVPRGPHKVVDKKMRARKWILENEYCLCPGEGGIKMYRRRKPSTALFRNLRKRVLPSNPRRLSYSCAFAVWKWELSGFYTQTPSNTQYTQANPKL